MTPDEMRLLPNKYAVLFIRGELPIKDEKYDILKHPNVKYTSDGDGEIYNHGKTNNAIASFTPLENINLDDIPDIEDIDIIEEIKILAQKYEFLSDDEL